MSVLVLAAHPDDEVLGCGATIRRLATEGSKVHLSIFGEGATSRQATREEASTEAVELLAFQARTVAGILGAASLRTMGLPDNRFDTLPMLDVVKKVEALIDELRPAVVFTHHPGDLNVDHQVLFQAVMTACRPQQGHPVREVLCFEIPSSTDWAFQRCGLPFRPSVFYDVSRTLPVKLEAMAVYESEARPFPHPRSTEALNACAIRWGSTVGVAAAEAFEAVRVIR